MQEENWSVVIKELCRRVGLAYPLPPGEQYEVDAATWTKAEEDDFRVWLTDYCKTVPKFKRRGLRWIKQTVDWFIFNFSWKYKESE